MFTIGREYPVKEYCKKSNYPPVDTLTGDLFEEKNNLTVTMGDRMGDMPKLSISEAARQIQMSRNNLYKSYINTGKISLEKDKNSIG